MKRLFTIPRFVVCAFLASVAFVTGCHENYARVNDDRTVYVQREYRPYSYHRYYYDNNYNNYRDGHRDYDHHDRGHHDND